MPKKTPGLEDTLIVNALNRIDGKLDKLDDRLDGQGNILAKQQVSLDEHVKRTNLLEAKLEEDKKLIKEGLAREALDAVRAERNRILVLGLKIGGAVAGLGGTGFGLKTLLPAIAKLWSGE